VTDLPYAPWLVSRKDATKDSSTATTRPFGFIGTWHEIKKNGTAPKRYPQREEVCALFAREELHFYDAHVCKSTHGYQYDQLYDGPAEKHAHQKASIFVYLVRDAISANAASRGLIETNRDKNIKGRPSRYISVVWWLDETQTSGHLKPEYQKLREKLCSHSTVHHALSFAEVERYIREFLRPPKSN
jgi:hypothetical protein